MKNCVQMHVGNDSILVVVSLEHVIMSIFLYLKKLANELPQPADVPSVPASTMVAVNLTLESTLSKKVLLEYNRYSYRNKLDTQYRSK